MKRKFLKSEKWDARISEKKFFYRIKRKKIKYDPYKFKVNKQYLFSSKLISAPPILCVYTFDDDDDAYRKTLSFVKMIEKEFSKGNCIFDFSEVRRVSVAALLIVYATIEHCKNRFGGSIIYSKYSKMVNVAIKETNVNRLIKERNYIYRPKRSSIMPVISGVSNQYIDGVIDYIQEEIYKNNLSADKEFAFGDAVSETINNVWRWAYPTLENEQKKWWLVTQVVNRQLFLAIYDIGVGIPKTVVRKNWFISSLKYFNPTEYKEIMNLKEIKEKGTLDLYLMGKIPDHNLIQISMKGDVSGTKEDKHGQGSKSIKALVTANENGKLWVYSNKGLLTFTGEDDDVTTRELPAKIKGTLIQWNIKIA